MSFSGTILSRVAPAVLVTVGSLIVANVAWPIMRQQISQAHVSKEPLVAPIPFDQVAFAGKLPDVDTVMAAAPAARVGDSISNWLPTTALAGTEHTVKEYVLSIPKVAIEDAVVTIGGEDLSESLIQYPGTANPGQLGSPVIFGHSVLRQFYNPQATNPRRYVSIFSKIMTLKNGDEITLEYDGIVYTYEVKDKYEVKPEDVFILQQRYNNRELKLVTCVPEGTYLRRGVVVAQLKDIHKSSGPSKE